MFKRSKNKSRSIKKKNFLHQRFRKRSRSQNVKKENSLPMKYRLEKLAIKKKKKTDKDFPETKGVARISFESASWF